MSDDIDMQKQLALTIAKDASATEADALRKWAWDILQIREESLSALEKGKKAVSLTASNRVIFPAMRIIARQTKKYGWDDRSSTQRLGMGVAAAAIALFGGANAGIAALGGAIGVPVWVVLGGGSMFAKYLYDELRQEDKSAVTYKVLDADKEQP